jgi:asparagine synthase (glutamine-hydrolysing)
MCGIAGFITDGQLADRELIAAMCDRISHRGPDSAGYYFDGSVALGHRRLSIIDLSTGDQPLGNEDGSVQVVFNGEIYNYLELRHDLIERGHVFRTSSDTEVLVHLYEESGERMAESLNGMFAFAIWDKRRRHLLLARDRFGKKPLYYTVGQHGLRLSFASELKALRVIEGVGQQIDHCAMANFLALGYVPDPATIYGDVRKLPPGHTLLVTPEGHRTARYWTPVFAPSDRSSFDDSTEELHSLATDAVRRRMISDVPLGAFLSGGIDSTALTGMMSEVSSEAVKSFSIGFTDPEFDELPYAQLAALKHNTEHYTEVVTPSVEEILGKLVDTFDEPFGDSSAIPMLYLSRMTRQHVTVALAGDGADELFGGYRRYRHGVIEEQMRQRIPEWCRRSVVGTAGRWYPKFDYLPQMFRAKSLLTNLAGDIGNAYFNSMSAFRDDGLKSILSTGTMRELGAFDPRVEYRDRFRRVRHLDPLGQMQAVDLETYLPGDILVKADRATMAYSLESRSPWLDYRISELAGRFPASFKIQGFNQKRILKAAMTDYIPEPLLHRKKMGFSVPLASWMRTSLKPIFEDAVLQDGVGGLLSIAEVRHLWVAHQSKLHDHSRKLWYLLVLGLWHKAHFSKSNSPLALALANG